MDMDLDKIQRLLELVAESGMAEVKVEEGDFKLTVRSTPKVSGGSGGSVVMAAPAAAPSPAASAPAAAPSAPAEAAPAAAEEPGSGANEELVRAPIVGTFYAAPSPDSDPFVSVGDTVSAGQTVCIIEAMKLMNEVPVEVSGTIKQVLVQNAEPVEYDQPLFVIEK